MTDTSAAATVRNERFILCEGYDDRAFWAAWLKRLGCKRAPGKTPIPGGREFVYGPDGKELPPGHFGYLSRNGAFLTLVPCYGKDNIPRELRLRLQQRDTKPIDRVVVNVDPDTPIDVGLGASVAPIWNEIDAVVRFADAAAVARDDGQWDVGSTTVSLVCWGVEALTAPGIPDIQTLERLVCASIVQAYPGRGENVQQWLSSREAGPPAGPKHFAWSYYAGWFADHGTGDYYRCIWDDPNIAGPLEQHLRASGAWAVAEAMAE